jgi:hypothetical protein
VCDGFTKGNVVEILPAKYMARGTKHSVNVVEILPAKYMARGTKHSVVCSPAKYMASGRCGSKGFRPKFPKFQWPVGMYVISCMVCVVCVECIRCVVVFGIVLGVWVWDSVLVWCGGLVRCVGLCAGVLAKGRYGSVN